MSAINERVSPKRLAEIIARAEVCDDSVLTDYRDIESIARELQQYRAAAEPVVSDSMALAFHAAITDSAAGADDIEEIKTGLRAALANYAAPQVTSVPDEMTYEQAREITSKKSFLVDRDSPASLFAAGYNACRMDVYLAAPAVQAEQLSGNAEQVTKCWCHTCRPVTMTDMRFVVCPDCGHKRCPHANDHRNACTGSNEPGQEGSAYPAAPKQEAE